MHLFVIIKQLVKSSFNYLLFTDQFNNFLIRTSTWWGLLKKLDIYIFILFIGQISTNRLNIGYSHLQINQLSLLFTRNRPLVNTPLLDMNQQYYESVSNELPQLGYLFKDFVYKNSPSNSSSLPCSRTLINLMDGDKLFCSLTTQFIALINNTGTTVSPILLSLLHLICNIREPAHVYINSYLIWLRLWLTVSEALTSLLWWRIC